MPSLGLPAGRLVALDVFRGATVAAMIFVNNPGDWGHLYAPFAHAEWHGWTPTDLIFPFFLFIVGTAGVLSLDRRIDAGASPRELARHAAVRGATIVLVGWLLAWFPFGWDRLERLRIPGVLPRIGVVFVAGTWIVLAAGRSFKAVATAAALLLGVHTFVLLGTGYDLTLAGNVQTAVDLALLEGHLWKKTWDPEGIVGTLGATATMLSGTLAGLVVTSGGPLRSRIATLCAGGAAVAAAGLVAGLVLPVNKGLWTASYVLLTSGLGAAALGLSLWLVDERHVRRPLAPLVTFGSNPLAAFVLSGLLAKVLGLVKVAEAGRAVSLHRSLFQHGFGWIEDPALASHAFAAVIVLVWWGALRGLEARGLLWKV